MKILDRQIKRIVFVNHNINLILKLDSQQKEKGWNAFVKNPLVDEIADRARRYLEFSIKTNNCDIVWPLYQLAKKLSAENIRYQLKR
jgi:hypothetical protein